MKWKEKENSLYIYFLWYWCYVDDYDDDVGCWMLDDDRMKFSIYVWEIAFNMNFSIFL